MPYGFTGGSTDISDQSEAATILSPDQGVAHYYNALEINAVRIKDVKHPLLLGLPNVAFVEDWEDDMNIQTSVAVWADVARRLQEHVLQTGDSGQVCVLWEVCHDSHPPCSCVVCGDAFARSVGGSDLAARVTGARDQFARHISLLLLLWTSPRRPVREGG